MSANTKGSIMDMCRQHIDNPNSIILCIQDASRDAEGSSVADLVHTADPTGVCVCMRACVRVHMVLLFLLSLYSRVTCFC